MIEARFTYTEQYALEASRQITRVVAPFVTFLPYIGWLMISGIVYAWVVNRSAPWDGVNPAVVGPLFCAMPWWTRRQLRKQFRSSPEAGLQQVWRVTEYSLTIETRGATSTFDWSKLVRVKERSGGFLLFPQPRIAYWIPLSAFGSDSDAQTFREYVERSSVPKKG